MDDLQQKIIDEFNSDTARKIYIEEAKKGLWKSEEILIKKYFREDSSVLDVGCGTGRTTIPLIKMGYRVTGVDISAGMIENAKRISSDLQLDIDFQIGDATLLRFPSRCFDNAIFSFNGWTQIPSHQKRIRALQEIYRILKPGGYFIFTINSRSYFSKYVYFWTKQWIKVKVLKPAGFRIPEQQFGDMFFRDQGRSEQFIHIPSVNEVKRAISRTKFKLVEYQKAEEICTDQYMHESVVFFICTK